MLFLFSRESSSQNQDTDSCRPGKEKEWIHRLVQVEGFDSVVIFSTANSLQQAKQWEQAVLAENVDVRFVHELLPLKDSQDYQEAFDVFRSSFESYSAQYPNTRFSILLNSGTQTIQAVWLLLGAFKHMPLNILQIQENQDPVSVKHIVLANKEEQQDFLGSILEVKEHLAFFLDDLPLKMGLVGSSKRFNQALESCFNFAEQNRHILFCGEEGVGKKTFARLAKVISEFRNKKSYTIDASDPSQYQELNFAIQSDEPSAISVDKIEDLPESYQTMLLNAIASHHLLLCTSQNIKAVLPSLINAFSGSIIKLPSLRERIEDMPQIIKAVLDQINIAKGTRLTISSRSMKLLIHRRWPDNILGLYRTLEAAAIVCETREILPEDLGLKWMHSKEASTFDLQ